MAQDSEMEQVTASFGSASTTLAVTVLIPAYNEELNVSRAVRQALDEPWGEHARLDAVVVVDDCSGDDTYAIASALAASEPRVSVLRNEQRGGKNAGIRAASRGCRSDVMVVVDADVLVPMGSLYKTVALLANDASLMAASCIVEPLPAQDWTERASRSQALFVSELKRRGQAYLSALCALRSPAFEALDIPDDVADDAYITLWLDAHGYRYAVRRDAMVYIRAAVGLRDFAKQTLRGRSGEKRTKTAVAVGATRKRTSFPTVSAALLAAFVRDPLGFFLYCVWYAVVLATPRRWWLSSVSLSTFETVGSTKRLDKKR